MSRSGISSLDDLLVYTLSAACCVRLLHHHNKNVCKTLQLHWYDFDLDPILDLDPDILKTYVYLRI